MHEHSFENKHSWFHGLNCKLLSCSPSHFCFLLSLPTHMHTPAYEKGTLFPLLKLYENKFLEWIASGLLNLPCTQTPLWIVGLNIQYFVRLFSKNRVFKNKAHNLYQVGAICSSSTTGKGSIGWNSRPIYLEGTHLGDSCRIFFFFCLLGKHLNKFLFN